MTVYIAIFGWCFWLIYILPLLCFPPYSYLCLHTAFPSILVYLPSLQYALHYTIFCILCSLPRINLLKTVALLSLANLNVRFVIYLVLECSSDGIAVSAAFSSLLWVFSPSSIPIFSIFSFLNLSAIFLDIFPLSLDLLQIQFFFSSYYWFMF